MPKALTPDEIKLCADLQVDIMLLVRKHKIQTNQLDRMRILCLALTSALAPAMSCYLEESASDSNSASKELLRGLVDSLDVSLDEALGTTVTAALEVIRKRAENPNL